VQVIALAVLFTALHAAYLQLVSEQSLASLLIEAVAAGIASALVWSQVSWQLGWSRRDRILALWLAVFVIHYLNNILEGYFYTNYLREPARIGGALLVGAAMGAAQGAAAGWIAVPTKDGDSVRGALRRLLASRPVASWIWRLALAAVAWLPIYLLFGAVAGPYVVEAYEESEEGLALPSIPTILVAQLVRGALYVVALLPLLAGIELSRPRTWALLALILYVPGALIPFFASGGSVPSRIIPFHVAELLADSAVYALVLVWLLAKPKPVADDGPGQLQRRR
jgi:hypothetical protein